MSWQRSGMVPPGNRAYLRPASRDGKGIAIVGVFAYAESLKVVVMFHQFGLDERAGGIGA